MRLRQQHGSTKARGPLYLEGLEKCGKALKAAGSCALRKNPSLPILKLIAAVLGVPVGRLLE